ncbi:MAG TPA: VWA domain-containing protein [Pyrinomonadaceae bacterium]|jgi:VWFA-related protein|nr:VWA domain-containing protein [Pyrinomonadaceae bacterium]
MKLSYFRHNQFSRYLVASLLGAFLLVCTSTRVLGQDDDVVRTETNLVQLNVGVVDGQGRAITSLSRNDFTIFEDGVKQQILHFDPADTPFSLVLLLDVSGSTLSFRPQFKQAAMRFLDALAPEDRVAIVQFNAKIKVLAGFSKDRDKLAYSIERADGGGETHLYEALKFALNELEKEGKQRRKAVVVLTDGLDTQLRNADRPLLANAKTDQEAIAAIDPKTSGTLNAVLSAADSQGVSIFPLALPSGDPKRLPLPDPVITGIYSAARARLQILADRTGGRVNDIQRLDQMARLYAEVAAELRTLYTVAYQPPGERARNGKWHEIKIEVGHPELIVRTRPGYFAR